MTATCAERIQGELAQRNAMLRQVMDNPDYDDYFDDPALSLEQYSFTRVCFSYGGPSDYLEVIHKGTEVIRAEYVFQDWYDGARTHVVEGSPMHEYAMYLIENLEEA